jgi:hypothetical protein
MLRAERRSVEGRGGQCGVVGFETKQGVVASSSCTLYFGNYNWGTTGGGVGLRQEGTCALKLRSMTRDDRPAPA